MYGLTFTTDHLAFQMLSCGLAGSNDPSASVNADLRPIFLVQSAQVVVVKNAIQPESAVRCGRYSFDTMGVYLHEIVVEHKFLRVESVSHSLRSVGFEKVEKIEADRTEEKKREEDEASFIVVSFDCF